MSMTFFIKGGTDDTQEVNLSNSNAAQVLEFLGLYEEAMNLGGTIKARDLIQRCQAALQAPQLQQANQEVQPSTQRGERGAWLIHCGRREGYIEEKVRALKTLAESAGDLGIICFS